MGVEQTNSKNCLRQVHIKLNFLIIRNTFKRSVLLQRSFCLLSYFSRGAWHNPHITFISHRFRRWRYCQPGRALVAKDNWQNHNCCKRVFIHWRVWKLYVSGFVIHFDNFNSFTHFINISVQKLLFDARIQLLSIQLKYWNDNGRNGEKSGMAGNMPIALPMTIDCS